MKKFRRNVQKIHNTKDSDAFFLFRPNAVIKMLLVKCLKLIMPTKSYF